MHNQDKSEFWRILRCGGLALCDRGFTICGDAFVLAFFLAHYPPQWLVYLYMAQSIVPAITLTLINYYIQKKPTARTNVIILVIFDLLTIAASISTVNPFYWLPFVICAFLNTAIQVVTILSSNTISAALSFTQFKENFQFINILRPVSGVSFGIIVFYIANKFGTIWITAVLICLISLSIYLTYRLPFAKILQQPKKFKSSPYTNSHFVMLAIYMVCLELAIRLANYVFGFTLGEEFSRDQTTAYLGLYYSSIDLLWLLLSLTILKPIITKFGLKGTLAALPIGYIVLAACVIYDRNILTATLFTIVSLSFNGCFRNMGFEFGMNVLMKSTRENGKFQIRLLLCLAIFICAWIAWLSNLFHLSVQFNAAIGLIVCIYSLLILKKISTNYLAELAKSVTFKRYDPSLLILGGHSEVLMERAFASSIVSQIPDNLEFTLSVSPHTLREAPPKVLEILSSKNKQTRLLVAKFILKRKLYNSENKVFDQLKKEDDPEVIKLLFENMTLFNPRRALPLAESYFTTSDPDILAGILPILIEEGDLEIKETAIKKLNTMLNSIDCNDRKQACNIIMLLKHGSFNKTLQKLLHDPSSDVVLIALKAIWEKNEEDLIPEIASMLTQPKLRRRAIKTLVKFSQRSIKYLENLLHQADWVQLRAITEILAGINSQQAQAILLQQYLSFDPLIQYYIINKLANLSINRKKIFNLQKEAKNKIFDEFSTMELLEKAYHLYDSPFIRHEIALRMELAIKRWLLWIAVYTGDSRVLELMPSLIATKKNQIVEHNRGITLELLENLINDLSIKIELHALEQLQKFQYTSNQKNDLHELKDAWLEYVIKNIEVVEQPNSINLEFIPLILRKTQLFHNLQAEILLQCVQEAKVIEIKQAAYLFKEGDPYDKFYIIISGNIDIELESQGIHLASLKEYDFFGELGLLDKSARTASAIAKTDCKLLYFSIDLFEDLICNTPELLWELTRIIIQYLKQNLEIGTISKISHTHTT